MDKMINDIIAEEVINSGVINHERIKIDDPRVEKITIAAKKRIEELFGERIPYQHLENLIIRKITGYRLEICLGFPEEAKVREELSEINREIEKSIVGIICNN